MLQLGSDLKRESFIIVVAAVKSVVRDCHRSQEVGRHVIVSDKFKFARKL